MLSKCVQLVEQQIAVEFNFLGWQNFTMGIPKALKALYTT